MKPQALLDLEVRHEFHSDGICQSLVFEADPATRSEVARRRLALRLLPGRVQLFAMPDSILDADRVECRFTARSLDPLFELRTECPGTNSPVALHYSADRRLEDGATLEPRLEEAPPSPPGRPIRLVVDCGIAAGAGEAPAAAIARIALRTRSFLWKYHLMGEFARRKVEIADLDPTGDPIRFAELSTSGPDGSACWISERGIPAREIAPQRLQLRDAETGRVLVKRLPNPDFRTFGREPLRTGALVVEAFIHP